MLSNQLITFFWFLIAQERKKLILKVSTMSQKQPEDNNEMQPVQMSDGESESKFARKAKENPLFPIGKLFAPFRT